MNLAIVNRKPVDFQRKQLLDLLRPRFVHWRLASLFGRPVHQVHLRSMQLDVAYKSPLEDECSPLHRKIDKRRGEKRNGHLSAGLLDVDVMNLVRPAPKMKRNRSDMSAVAMNFGELSIHVIAHPNRQIRVHDHEGCENNDQ